jgi:GNAT superfamily N-acetyltransferase
MSLPVSPVVISPALDLLAGLAQAKAARLYDSDAENSHVLEILKQANHEGLHGRARDILDLWLAHDTAQKPMGMAVITEERVNHQQIEVINVFVAPQARGMGVGRALIVQAQSCHPKLQGHYTADSIALYQALNIPDFDRHHMAPGAAGDRHLGWRHAGLHLIHTQAKMASQAPLTDQAMAAFLDVETGPGRMHRAGARDRRRRR